MEAPLDALMVTDWPEGTAPLTGEITGAANCVSEGVLLPPQPTNRSTKIRQAMEQILMSTIPLIWDRKKIISLRRRQQIVIYVTSLCFSTGVSGPPRQAKSRVLRRRRQRFFHTNPSKNR
jgi:tryptophan synthase alpha subunit